MAINVKIAGESTPRFATDTGVGTTCTQIRAEAGVSVTILASGAIYLFNGVAEGGSVPAVTSRIELSADEAAQGIKIKVGRVYINGRMTRMGIGGTICVAAKTGTVTVRVIAER